MGSAVDVVNLLVAELFSPTQFIHVLSKLEDADPYKILRKVLTNRALFQVNSTSFYLFNVCFEFKVLGRETLKAFQKLMRLQFQRKNFFLETISQNYTVRYSNSSLDTLVESVVDRAAVAKLVIQHYRLHRTNLEEVIVFVKALRDEFSSEHSLTTHFTKLFG